MKKYLILLFALTACQPTAHDRESFKTLKLFEMPKSELEFESVRFVHLSSREDHMLGQFPLTRFYHGDIYLLDNNGQKNILRFTGSGEFLNHIGKEGRGAEEHMGANDFTEYGDTIFVLTSYGEDSKIISYLKDGTFVKSIPVGVLGRSFEKIPEGFIVNTGTSPMFSHRFYIIDPSGNILDSLLRNETRWEFGMTEENFATHRSEVFIHEALRNELYVFRSGVLEQTYHLDLSGYNIPQDFYSKSLMEAFPELQRRGFGTIRNYFENARYSIFDIVLQKAGDDARIHQFTYDKKQDELYEHSFTGSEDADAVFQHLIGFTENNELIYLLYPVEVMNKLQTLKNYETGKESKLEGMTEMDNPIIAYCKLAR